jgi:peptidoglycan/LPS O-acetylase OafA/YrhL
VQTASTSASSPAALTHLPHEKPALQYLGTISYGAYLWNYPMSGLYSPAEAIIATIIVASISYWGFERYFLRHKQHSSPTINRRTVAPADTDSSSTPAQL